MVKASPVLLDPLTLCARRYSETYLYSTMAAASTVDAVWNLLELNNKPYSLQNLVDLLAHAGTLCSDATDPARCVLEH